MKDELNKSFKISYIINCIIFFIVLFWFVNIFRSSGNLLEDLAFGFAIGGLYLIHFVISIIVFIITMILGIKNYKKITNANIKKKLTLMMCLMGIAHFIMLTYLIITIILV